MYHPHVCGHCRNRHKCTSHQLALRGQLAQVPLEMIFTCHACKDHFEWHLHERVGIVLFLLPACQRTLPGELQVDNVNVKHIPGIGSACGIPSTYVTDVYISRRHPCVPTCTWQANSVGVGVKPVSQHQAAGTAAKHTCVLHLLCRL